ncbi:hypothetical protein ESB13_20215 [Filimonas effusa]|uniref:Cyanobacterial TRADD-N associated 2 transmembrane domain-containing protein n=2 Tax=Filimonas effusa TaxID=2508721 RepID=A0A4Q1D0J4_9BACT|nr:hypothetical protein ESB13_20215 [Filimonas effusa]
MSNLIKGIITGGKIVKRFAIAAGVLALASAIIAYCVDKKVLPYNSIVVIWILGGASALILIGISSYQMLIDQEEAAVEIKKVEDKIKESPTKSWELGRMKLESYLNRNLKQVQSIFVWTVIVMLFGFAVIWYGIIKLYQGGGSVDAAMLTTVSGLIIEVIGGSFLLIYKSTMKQAKEYVTVLERINAVGMSVQILDSISQNESKLQDQARAEIAKQLLELYGGIKK